MRILEVQNVTKIYRSNEVAVKALDNVSLAVDRGDLIVILGKSGSGKSTLLNVMGGIENPDSGKIIINGISLYDLKEEKRVRIRSSYIGYVFQTFNLIEELTVLENVRLPLDISNRNYEKSFEQKIFSLLEIESRLKFYPNQLSGGERQRVAIARALLIKPQIVLADEPTGNLDSQSSKQFMEFVKKSCYEFGQTFVVVTHDDSWIKIAKKIYYVKDGCIGEEYYE